VPLVIKGQGGPITIAPFRQIHGDIDSLGLRIGELAYSCDISDIPQESSSYLEGMGMWIVDALRYRPHPSHFSLNEALAWIERLKPRQAFLTHMHNDLDYQRLMRELPARVAPAFDGMQIIFEAD
jgi:phosphoribosyl 1,2-cyclic phosphate phosphodiesterase